MPDVPYLCERFIRHKPPGPHPRLRLTLPSPAEGSIWHRNRVKSGNRCRSNVESMPNRPPRRARRGGFRGLRSGLTTPTPSVGSWRSVDSSQKTRQKAVAVSGICSGRFANGYFGNGHFEFQCEERRTFSEDWQVACFCQRSPALLDYYSNILESSAISLELH